MESEHSMARRIRAREPEALEWLLSTFTSDVYRLVRAILGSAATPEDVEETVADAFVAAWRHGPRYDPTRAPLRTWMLMQAKYAALERRRRDGRIPRAAIEPIEPDACDPFDVVTGRTSREALRRALNALPAGDRELLYRRYFLEESIADLAVSSGISRSALDSRLWRARQALRAQLAEDTREEPG